MKIKMAVIKDNIEKCVEAGVYGANPGRAGMNVKRMLELEKGDKVIFYATGISKFAGIFEVTEPFYESEEKIWEDDIYPYRVRIKPVIYLPKEKWIDVRTLVNDLEYFRNKDKWSLHFLNNLMPVSEKDYELIKSKMEEALKG